MSTPGYIPLVTTHSRNFTFDIKGITKQDTKQQLLQNFTTKMDEAGVVFFANAINASSIPEYTQAAKHCIVDADKALQFRHPQLDVGNDAFAFEEIGTRGKFRFDLVVSGDDPETESIRSLVRQGSWVPLIHDLLFPPHSDHHHDTDHDKSQCPDLKCILSIIYSRPGAPDQSWHADGHHLGPVCDALGLGAEPPYAVCVFVPLTPASKQVGFTQFWPGTHKTDKLLGFGSGAEVIGGTLDALVESGSCVVYDYRLMHRGMGNFSVDTERSVLQFVYHVPAYQELKNYGEAKLF
eukprot:c946_g1_i2.p1 GENE.c946_g1_i2~~c946_g1_i2.p1  ORF type:complete len:294 (+),score=50.19 c946_g1_i2:435-1316(+)